MPSAVCLAISRRPNISNLISSTCKCLYRLEPSHHCVMIANCGLDVQPINNKTFKCRVFLKKKGGKVLSNNKVSVDDCLKQKQWCHHST